MAASLIETMAADFEPEKYEDDYQIQLKELIEAKAAVPHRRSTLALRATRRSASSSSLASSRSAPNADAAPDDARRRARPRRPLRRRPQPRRRPPRNPRLERPDSFAEQRRR